MAPTVMLILTKQYTRTFCVYSSSYEFDLVCRRLCWPPTLLGTWNNASLWKKRFVKLALTGRERLRS